MHEVVDEHRDIVPELVPGRLETVETHTFSSFSQW